MEMDETCEHNIEIPLTFTHGAKPGSTCNINEYNDVGSALIDFSFDVSFNNMRMETRSHKHIICQI